MPVQKGIQTDKLVEVYGDLKPGDILVKAATDEIRDGQTVNDKTPESVDAKD